MNILLINNYFPPEVGAASHLYYELGKELVKRKHNIQVLTGIPRYNINEEEYNK
jgi:colanic acid biosynthesis glycosyl transferase WcaI